MPDDLHLRDAYITVRHEGEQDGFYWKAYDCATGHVYACQNWRASGTATGHYDAQAERHWPHRWYLIAEDVVLIMPQRLFA